MSISGINIFNSKMQQLSAYAAALDGTDNSLFSAKLSTVNPDMVEDMLSQGMSQDSVVSQLLSYINADKNNEELIEMIEDELGDLVEAINTEFKANKSENEEEDAESSSESQPDSETPSEPEAPTTPESPSEGEQPQLTQSPIQQDTQNWNLEDTGNLFSENITRDGFLEEFNKLNENTTDNDTFAAYLSAMNDMGAENFFTTLDANNDGTLDSDELAALTNADGDDTSISANEFNNIFNKYLEDNGLIDPTTPEGSEASEPTTPDATTPEPTTPEATTPTTPEQASDPPSVPATDNTPDVGSTQKPSGSSGGSDYNPTVGSNNGADTTSQEPKETVEDLIKQKQEIISEADTKIDGLNKQIDDLINNSSVDQELKENYTNAKTAYEANQKSISDNDTKIESYDTDLHDISKSLAALNGEKENLATDTSDEEVNKKNSARKTEIDKNIAELNAKKEKIEKDKAALEATNKDLNTEATTLKTTLDEAYAAVEAALPDEIKTQIADLKSQIQTIETEKTQKVSEIDSKIQTLKTQEVQESKESGAAVGKLASNPIGSKFVEYAMKYNGMKGGSKFSTGNYGWCADFVTYVVKEVASSLGMSKEAVRQLGHEHLGASPQKLIKKNKGHVIETKGMSIEDLTKAIQPGMAFICRGGGASGRHTGFVAEVYPDGTFLSIEGNHGNKVCQVRRNISDMFQFVDFSYLFN